MKELYPAADAYRVVLYGSLAKTGKGHMTDKVLEESFAPLPVEVVFDMSDKADLEHPCAMDMIPLKDGRQLSCVRIYSIGGGAIRLASSQYVEAPEVYPHNSFDEIAVYCKKNDLRLWQYVERMEGL